MPMGPKEKLAVRPPPPPLSRIGTPIIDEVAIACLPILVIIDRTYIHIPSRSAGTELHPKREAPGLLQSLQNVFAR